MKTDLPEILDDCLERIINGEALESCLSAYPDERLELEPMLLAALSISEVPEVQPSAEFVASSRSRLLNRISRETPSGEELGAVTVLRDLWRNLTQSKKLAVPIGIIAILIIIGSLFQFGGPGLIPPALVEDPPGTLTILSGSVEIQAVESEEWLPGTDGMAVRQGMGVRTDENSHAILTFFEGSTIKLDPDTYLEINRAEEDEQQSTAISLKQWLGRTWSRVTKMVDSGSSFEVETPSATAIVRGTLFSTEVEETGLTTVATTEGVVSVAAQGEEVFISADQQTLVEQGTQPTEAVIQDAPTSGLRISIDAEVDGSVTDPTGASTGQLPDGITFNQIAGSQSLITPENTQVILVPDPVTGEYTISLRFDSPKATSFTIQYLSGDEVISEHSGRLMPVRSKEWRVQVNLVVEDGEIVSADLGDIIPIGDNPAEKIPGVTKSASKRQDKDKNEDKGPDEDKGNSDDKGPDGDKGKSEGKGSDQNQGKNEDKGPDTDKGVNSDNGLDDTQDGNQGQDGNKGGNRDKGTDGSKGGNGDKGLDDSKGGNGDKGSEDNKGGNGDKGSNGNKGGNSDKGSDDKKGGDGDKGTDGNKGGNGDKGEGGDKDPGGNKGKDRNNSDKDNASKANNKSKKKGSAGSPLNYDQQ